MRKRLASRGSALALWQARHVLARVQAAHADLAIDIDVVTTTGDRIRDVPLAHIGETGLFTKEIDATVLEGRADFAVHSLKDVPTQPPEGLVLAAVVAREDPRDALLTAPGMPATLLELPQRARVGTSSLRRRALLRAVRADLDVVDLRGNLDTRISRLKNSDYDAIILAAAGLRRLGWEEEIAQLLEPPDWLPAPGQGALAVLCRTADAEMRALLTVLDDAPTRAAVTAERALLRTLEGGCQIPIGALGSINGDRLVLHAFVASIEGSTCLRADMAGSVDDAAQLGRTLAESMIARGADSILDEVRAAGEDGVPRPTAP